MSDGRRDAEAAASNWKWPEAALRPPRVVTGRPENAVPWGFTTVDRVRVWDNDRGLVELRDLANADEHAHPNSAELSMDGLALKYRISWNGQHAHYSLVTGGRRLTPPVPWSRQHQVHGPSGVVLTAEDTDIRPRLVETFNHDEYGNPRQAYSNEAWGGRYTITDSNGLEEELPLDLPEGGNQGTRGATAQFCDDGHLVAVSHRIGVGPTHTQSVSVTDWRRGDTRSFEGVSLAAVSVWSPDATRLVVGRLSDLVPQVLDLRTGSRSELGGAFDDPYGPVTREVVGWLDDEHLIVLQVRDRRLQIGAHELATGRHHPLLDTSLTSSFGDFGGLLIAPPVLHASPHPFGLPASTTS